MEKKNNCLEKSIHNKEKDQKIDYIARLKEISTPAEEDWFKIAEEWEKEETK